MTQPSPLGPSAGLNVIHLFCHKGLAVDRAAVHAAVNRARDAGVQVVTVSIMGAKADVCVLALSKNLWDLRTLQTGLQGAGLIVSEAMLNARLYPELPPVGMNSFCFYPMSKRRGEEHNWFSLPYEERESLMRQHGASGREFKGRILQLVTGSTGLDDWEWGVTLFGVHVDDLKDCVYTMRFDEASTLYGEFGAFYTGMVGSLDDVLDASVA